ncbi:hypothetical protein BH11PAT4_BH11PAT4_4060 [soil metagenome]
MNRIAPIGLHRDLLKQAADMVVPAMLKPLFENGTRSHGFKSSLGFSFAFANVLPEDETNEETKGLTQESLTLSYVYEGSEVSEDDPMTIQEWVEKCAVYANDKLKVTVRTGVEGRTLHATRPDLIRGGDIIYVGSVIVDDKYGAGSGGPNHWDEALTREILHTYWALCMEKYNQGKAETTAEVPYMPYF